VLYFLHSFLYSSHNLGFRDIYPPTTGSRIFNCFYITGGILNLAVAVALIREVLLEGVALGFQDRVIAIHACQRERCIRTRWQAAVKFRLSANNLPTWVVDGTDKNDEQDWWRWAKQSRDFLRKRLSRKPAGRHLNLGALTEAQMEDAALEAGVPLGDLLPPGLHLVYAAKSYDMAGLLCIH
jgi:potassium channel subfamily K, other eukaryote